MWILSNPEFKRLRRAKLRPRILIIIMLGVLLVLGGIATLMYYAIVVSDKKPLNKMLEYYFWVATYFSLGVSTLFTMNLSAQNIAQERELNTYDFQRLVSMGSWRLAAGKLFGAPIEAVTLLGFCLPFVLAPVFALAVPFWLGIQVVMVLCLNLVLTSAASLACSSLAEKAARATGLGFFALIAMNFLNFFMFGLLDPRGPERFDPGDASPFWCFYHLHEGLNGNSFAQIAPGPVFPILGYLPVTLLLLTLFFCVTTRRLANEELAALSPIQALLLFIGFETVLIYTSMHTNYDAEFRFNVTSLAMLIVLSFLIMPSNDLLRSRAHRATRDEHWKLLREFRSPLEDHSPLPCMLLLILIYVAFHGIASFGYISTLEYSYNFNTTTSTYIWLPNVSTRPFGFQPGSLVLVCSVALAFTAFLLYLSYYMEKAVFRWGFLTLVVILVFPPIVCGILGERELLYNVSPILYLRRRGHSGFACPLVALALAVTFIVLAAMRLRFLLDIRALELKNQQIELERLRTGSAAQAEE